MPSVSFIIPVYNVEQYISKCLDSVCKQTLKDIEIICVNDASTDNSLVILKEYAINDNRINIINLNSNKGVSVARNIGISEAKGEYIAFIDSDDSIDFDFCEKLYEKAKMNDVDIAKGNTIIEFQDGTFQIPILNSLIESQKEKLYFTHNWWSAIYKKKLIQDNNILFNEKLTNGEDILFLNNVLLATNKKIVLVNDTYYHYNRRDDSSDSRILNMAKVKSILYAYGEVIDNILLHKDEQSISLSGVEFIFDSIMQSILNLCYRCKSMAVLDYIIEKVMPIYEKVKGYINTQTGVCELIIDTLKRQDKKELKELYLKHDTASKMLFANLRYIQAKRS